MTAIDADLTRSRAIAPLMAKLHDLLATDDLRVTADKLPIGCVVKCAGEYCGLVEFDGKRLRLSRPGSACDWWYPVSEGEVFMFDLGAF